MVRSDIAIEKKYRLTSLPSTSTTTAIGRNTNDGSLGGSNKPQMQNWQLSNCFNHISTAGNSNHASIPSVPSSYSNGTYFPPLPLNYSPHISFPTTSTCSHKSRSGSVNTSEDRAVYFPSTSTP